MNAADVRRAYASEYIDRFDGAYAEVAIDGDRHAGVLWVTPTGVHLSDWATTGMIQIYPARGADSVELHIDGYDPDEEPFDSVPFADWDDTKEETT